MNIECHFPLLLSLIILAVGCFLDGNYFKYHFDDSKTIDIVWIVKKILLSITIRYIEYLFKYYYYYLYFSLKPLIIIGKILLPQSGKWKIKLFIPVNFRILNDSGFWPFSFTHTYLLLLFLDVSDGCSAKNYYYSSVFLSFIPKF